MRSTSPVGMPRMMGQRLVAQHVAVPLQGRFVE